MNQEKDDEKQNPADDAVGYRKPPKQNQWTKGKSGNPKGRPRKPKKKPENTARDILRRMYNERRQVDGVWYSRLELELRQLSAAALKGNMQAIRILDKMRNESGLMQGKPPQRSGVLMVPVGETAENWEKRVAEAQRVYRENPDLSLNEITQELEKSLPKKPGS